MDMSSIISIEFAKIMPIIIGLALVGIILGLIVNFSGAILEFILSFSIVRYTVLACLLIFAVKTLVW